MSVLSVGRRKRIERKRTLLTIGLSHEDCARIPDREDGLPCPVHQVMTRSAALGALRKHVPSIIICERRLGDGAWNDILSATFEVSPAPPVIVASRHADEYLWAEVLNLGGYDVLSLPFDREEVKRVIHAAWRVVEKAWQTGLVAGMKGHQGTEVLV
jgi:DNA-binding NtrC family response regulator